MHAVVVGCARFSYLADGVVRLEHHPHGKFDDRPTFRAITAPQPQPFQSVTQDGDTHVLIANGVEIRYTPTGPLSRDNLVIRWNVGDESGEWRPGDVDRQNFGSTLTMDHLNRSMHPRGVHLGGVPGADRLGEENVAGMKWDFHAMRQQQPELVDGGEDGWRRIASDMSLWPAEFQQIAAMWTKFPVGPVSPSGYGLLDETGMAFYDPQTQWIDRDVADDYQNLFLWFHGRDYPRAMRQFTMLCGKVPMVPRWALGPWFSVFEKLTDEQNQAIVEDFAAHDIPLDVLIVDMDWHENDWNGFDWSDERFPDPPAFFERLREHGVKVALNIHAESISHRDSHFKQLQDRLGLPDGCEDNVKKDPGLKDSWCIDYVQRDIWEAMRDICFAPNEELGVDFWWIDHWNGRERGLNSVLWTNHLLYHHTAQRTGKRPINLGRYSGYGSHRYPAYFSGDTASHWEILEMELEGNMRAGQIGMNYFSHDLGGFVGACPGAAIEMIDPELYARWMQMGALSPVMRVHSDHGVREPWKYGKPVFKAVKAAYDLHARLTPYFYHLMREAYDSGLPIHRPLYFVNPEDGAGYDVRDQYWVGDRLLAAPVATAGGRRKVYIPKGKFYNVFDGEIVSGPTTLDRVWPLTQIPLFAPFGTILPQQDAGRRIGVETPDPLVLTIYPGGDDELALYEDDGETCAYESGVYSRWPIELRDDGETICVTLHPVKGGFPGMRQQRDVRLEIRFVETPTKVTIDGVADAQAWSYDQGERLLVVELPAVNASRATEVVVDR